MKPEDIADMMLKAVKEYVAQAEDRMKQHINDAIAAIELPEAIKGDQGEAGVAGKDGIDGKDGAPGKDAVAPTADEVAASMSKEFSQWAIGFERQAALVLERACERIPKPKDGKDALELKDLELNLGEDGRTISLGFKAEDEQLISKSIRLAVLLDQGVFKEGADYLKGDGVTYGGSFYIAQKDAPEGKPGSSDDWRLAVKRGRDGRESVKIERAQGKVTVKHGNAS